MGSFMKTSSGRYNNSELVKWGNGTIPMQSNMKKTSNMNGSLHRDVIGRRLKVQSPTDAFHWSNLLADRRQGWPVKFLEPRVG